MPDSGIADGTAYTSAFHDPYVRQQVVTQCTSGTRPTGVEGRMIAETDTNLFQVYAGAAWVPFGGWGAWATYTPTLTNATGATVSGAYTQLGKTGHFRINVTAGTATAAGTFTATLPAGWAVAAGAPAIPLQVLHNNGGGTIVTVSGRVLAGGGAATIYASTAGANFTLGQSIITAITGTIELA